MFSTTISKRSPSKYLSVRPGARYFHSVRLLQRVKELDPSIFTKSGIMVGLGEERDEVLQLMDDLRSADVDFLTIGQYLQPTKKHHPVVAFVPPDEFKAYADDCPGQGLSLVSASPLTRSSHHAGEDFARLKALRAESAPTIEYGTGTSLQSTPNPIFGQSMPRFRTNRRVPIPPPRMFDSCRGRRAPIRNFCRSAAICG